MTTRMLVGLSMALTAPALTAQDSHPTFAVGTARAPRGDVAFGRIDVAPGVDSALHIPVAVIHGAKPGQVVAFVAGSHGTEYASIVAMQRLIPRIDPSKVHGTVIVVPLINVASIEQMTPHLNPIDRKSMNGNYPGSATGTQTERALDAITREVIDQSDVIVDLHGGDLDEDLRSYSYWFRTGRASQDSATRALALAFGLEHVIVSDIDASNPATARSLSTQALARGKLAVVAEAGRSGLVLDEDVNELTRGALNLLAYLNVFGSAKTMTSSKRPVWLGSTGRVLADSAGMFFAQVQRGARVVPGMLLGYTTDYFGRRTGEIRSTTDGIVTFVRGVPSMWPRATLINVAPVLVVVPEWKKP